MVDNYEMRVVSGEIEINYGSRIAPINIGGQDVLESEVSRNMVTENSGSLSPNIQNVGNESCCLMDEAVSPFELGGLEISGALNCENRTTKLSESLS